MVEVPTADDAKSAGMEGAVNGLAAGIGQTLGRGILGPGVGTAAGGIGAAAMLDGTDRTVVSTLAVERGWNELMAGGSSGGDSAGVM